LYEPLGYRASDHDPVIVGLDPAPAAGTLAGAGVFDRFAFVMAAHFPRNASDPVGSSGFVRSLHQRLTSTSYDWLVVDGKKAVLQGTGRYDGTPGYGFQVSAIDGGWKPSQDRLRLIIWEADGDVVYDSQPGDPRYAAPTRSLTAGNLIVSAR
jgi:hypothetical protein